MEPAKRRIRLGMKQLVPTSLDEYIGEHAAGDVVTGRVADVRGGKAKVELGEGVTGYCTLAQDGGESQQQGAAAGVDLSALTTMLTARWKGGGASAGKGEPLRAGQVRSFRISRVDAAQKRIDLELAG
jgi:small subunit ribosomal protein S1